MLTYSCMTFHTKKISCMYAHKNCLTVEINPYAGYGRPYSEFQNLLFCILRKKQYRCQNFPIVFSLFSVAVTVSTHLCVICCHFCFRMTLFQGHVACQNIIVPSQGPQIRSCIPLMMDIIKPGSHLPLPYL